MMVDLHLRHEGAIMNNGKILNLDPGIGRDLGPQTGDKGLAIDLPLTNRLPGRGQGLPQAEGRLPFIRRQVTVARTHG
jgi:hypothetical protein